MKNKVEYGISQLHFGTYSVSDLGVVTLGTPYHVKGAVSFTPEMASENTDFFADNENYWSDYTDGKIEGDITVAKFDDEFRKSFLGYRELTDGGLALVKNAKKPNIYVAFQIEGDAESRRIIMYNGRLGAIKRDYNTTENNKEPTTESIPVSILGDKATGVPMARYKPGDDGYDTLFTAPTAPTFAEESE